MVTFLKEAASSEWGREGEKEERSEAGTESRGKQGTEGRRQGQTGKWQRQRRDDGSEVATDGKRDVEGKDVRMKEWRQELRGK